MENGQDKVAAFDTLFTTNQIQMLKILLTYVEPSQQKNMAVYIKFMELQYTISFFKMHPDSSLPCFSSEKGANASKICDEILPLCNPSEQDKISNMKKMMQTFENMQEMMQMIQLMKDFFPEGENCFGGDPSSLFSGLSNISGMDNMSQLFEMFQNNSS